MSIKTNPLKPLLDYCKELGLSTEFSLEDLVSSHRYLRSLKLENNTVFEESRNIGYELGIKQGMEKITECDFISIEKLKSMSVLELSNFLSEYKED